MKTRYITVADDLRARFRYQPAGTRLPTNEAIAKTYGITASTIRRATKILTEEGWVAYRPGAGLVVIDPNTKDGHTNTTAERIEAELAKLCDTLPHGAHLPGASEICRTYGCSEATARRALKGLLYSGRAQHTRPHWTVWRM